ncbi:MAG: response regulator [Bacteroidota bacterium]
MLSLSQPLGTWRLFVLLSLFWIHYATFSNVQAQHRDPVNNHYFVSEGYVLDHWTTDDGLPLNSIIDIIMSKNGYLWFATYDGLIRFNGVDFKIYDSSEHEELRGNRFQQLMEAYDGSLLIQSEGLHFSKFEGGAFTHLTSLDRQIYGDGVGMTFYKDSEKTIWMGWDKGIYRYREGELEPFRPDAIDFPVRKILYADESEVWFEAQENFALYRFDRNSEESVERIQDKSSYSNSVIKIGDTTWFVNSGNLFTYTNGTLDTVIDTEEYFFKGMALDAKGELVIASDNGFHSYTEADGLRLAAESRIKTPGKTFFFLEKNGVFWSSNHKELYENGKLVFKSDGFINSFIIDPEGSVWISSMNKGLFRLKPKRFKTINTSNGLTHNPIYPLFQSSDSSIWIGTFGRGLNQLKEGNIRSGFSLRAKRETDHGYIQAFEELNDSTLLVSIMGDGIQALKKGSSTLTPYWFNDQFDTRHIFSLFKDSRNRLWIGTVTKDSSGLFMEDIDAGTIEKISSNYGVPPAKVRYVHELPNGDIWFATAGDGIIHFDNNEYKMYSSQDGLASNYPRALHHTYNPVSNETILWVGYEDKGLDRITLKDGTPDLETITNYQSRDGLFDNSIHIILEQDDKFWFNTNRGIFWANIHELEMFHNKEIDHIYTRGYDEADGLLNREGNGGVQPAGFKALDGSIWFPTQQGIVNFYPDSICSNGALPPVIIETINSGELAFTPDSATITLPSSSRDLTISYASLSYLNPANNQYKYMLDGYDRDWQLVGERRTAYYTNLPKGTYTFKVQGTNNEGIWNTEGAQVVITVTPYFYETATFYILLTVIVFSLVFCCKYMMHVRHARKERRLQEEVKTRTKQLERERLKTEKQAQKLARLNEFQSRFFTNISHELRTPLTLIIGPLEDALNAADKGSYFDHDQLEMMLRNSKQLHKLINQILDISKYESGAIQLKPEVNTIYPFLKTIVHRFQDICTSKQITLELTANHQYGHIFIDSGLMDTVFTNLLSNAVKFTPVGGVINVHLSEDQNRYFIKITDSGVGIPEPYLEKVFDRFFQAEQYNINSASGSGLGLCIAKEIVDLHEGSIELTSTEGIGTSFMICLKKGFSHLAFTELHIAPPIEPGISETSSGHYLLDSLQEAAVTLEQDEFDSVDKTTILVIDDNTDIREYVSQCIPNTYRVQQACNGRDAYQRISKSLPDLIIADIMMPEMDGVELNKLLKKNPETASIPFIFLTAKDEKRHRIKRIKEGADVYITKPFDKQELLAHVENLLASRFRLREQLLNDLKNEAQPIITSAGTDDPFMEKLHEVLESEFSNPTLSVNVIREKLYMSRSTFYRKIVEKTGYNAQQYVNQFRLDKSKDMLIHQKASISEISYACGFNSLSYFSRSFKDAFGKSPSEFLKHQQVLMVSEME